ncbi:UNVERIFIED_CONTAM: hypothetical protein HDU68_007334 [Siphonaria sp. JEL0065]|nr:hypothetical protein HDU68_007334 [Siphonaria sp. JEL0065]
MSPLPTPPQQRRASYQQYRSGSRTSSTATIPIVNAVPPAPYDPLLAPPPSVYINTMRSPLTQPQTLLNAGLPNPVLSSSYTQGQQSPSFISQTDFSAHNAFASPSFPMGPFSQQSNLLNTPNHFASDLVPMNPMNAQLSQFDLLPNLRNSSYLFPSENFEIMDRYNSNMLAGTSFSDSDSFKLNAPLSTTLVSFMPGAELIDMDRFAYLRMNSMPILNTVPATGSPIFTASTFTRSPSEPKYETIGMVSPPAATPPALSSPPPMNQNSGMAKPPRFKPSEAELALLNGVFHKNPYPNASTRKRLADKLGLEMKQIQFWFQNRRALSKANGTPVSKPKKQKESSSSSTPEAEPVKEPSSSLLLQAADVEVEQASL